MKTIKQTYHIKSPVNEVWKALTDVEYINGWGGGPAEMDDKVGTKFKLWGGEIYGENIEVVPQNKLVQYWYGGQWPDPSIATFSLTVEDSGTKIDFHQKNVPEKSFKEIEQGWKDYYLGPLKVYLEKNNSISIP